MYHIYLFCFRLIIGLWCCLFLNNASAASSHYVLVNAYIGGDTIAPPKKPNKWLQWKPTAYFVGADVAKAVYNMADTNKLRLEFVAEAFLKNTNWLTVNVGICNAKYATNLLQYTSQSTGVLIGMSKSLFPFVNDKEMDNAFVGIGYGIATNAISQATYSFKDVWGQNTGIISSTNKIAHFAELNLGFRLALGCRCMASWRIQGKALLNNKSFTSIKPIYIANYGSGDASTSFGYNFVLTYRVK